MGLNLWSLDYKSRSLTRRPQLPQDWQLQGFEGSVNGRHLRAAAVLGDLSLLLPILLLLTVTIVDEAELKIHLCLEAGGQKKEQQSIPLIYPGAWSGNHRNAVTKARNQLCPLVGLKGVSRVTDSLINLSNKYCNHVYIYINSNWQMG